MLLIVSGNVMNVALQANHGPWQAWPRARPAQSQQQHPRRHSHGRHIVRGLQVPDEPAYDDLKLDDAYFKELGIDEDDQEAQKTYEPDDIGAACARHRSRRKPTVRSVQSRAYVLILTLIELLHRSNGRVCGRSGEHGGSESGCIARFVGGAVKRRRCLGPQGALVSSSLTTPR